MKKVLPVAVIATLLMSCQKDKNPNEVNAADKAFILQTYMAGKAEIAAGELALVKSANPIVQNFGQRVIADYRMAQSDLVAVAEKLDLSLTDTVATTIQSVSGLGEFTGISFDTAYLGSRTRSHMNTLSIFQEELNNGNNPYVRYYFLNKYIDKIRAYYSEADSLSRSFQ
jgi:putative membrane protein